jgi:hypothetical protein
MHSSERGGVRRPQSKNRVRPKQHGISISDGSFKSKAVPKTAGNSDKNGAPSKIVESTGGNNSRCESRTSFGADT